MEYSTLHAWKMDGLGNDFIIIDAREHPFVLTPSLARDIANRDILGADQVIVLRQPTLHMADVEMQIYNADGSISGACGNATRCVAYLLAQENEKPQITIQTQAGLLHAQVTSIQDICVDMGQANVHASQIPLSDANIDTLALPLSVTLPNGEILTSPVAVNMGNPHVVFFTQQDPDELPLHTFGPTIENQPLFPQRANVGLCQVINQNTLKLRVWERGAGLTQACGTGACAALVAAARKGLSHRNANVHLPGGILNIEWKDNNHVLMRGPVALQAQGNLLQKLESKRASNG